MLNFLSYAVVAVGLLVSFLWLGDSRPFTSGDLVGCGKEVSLEQALVIARREEAEEAAQREAA